MADERAPLLSNHTRSNYHSHDSGPSGDEVIIGGADEGGSGEGDGDEGGSTTNGEGDSVVVIYDGDREICDNHRVNVMTLTSMIYPW